MANLDDLYFVRAKNGPVKIGRSQNVPGRLRNIRTSCPVEVSCILTLPGKGWQEKIWHEALAEYRRRGEWFDYAAEVSDAIAIAKDGGEWWDAIWPFDFICEYVDPDLDIDDPEHEAQIWEAVEEWNYRMFVKTLVPPTPTKDPLS